MGKISFLNVGFGDATVINTSQETILIDCHDIETYSALLPSNKKLKALFITHQHADHYDGMDYLKNNGYSIEYLIYSPYQRRRGDNSVDNIDWQNFQNLKDYFAVQGTKLCPSYRQDNFNKPWWESVGLVFYMIGPAKEIADSASRELHDACLVFQVHLGQRRCLFTGDASDKSLNWIANNTNNYCNDILHVSHHGSLEGADLKFIKDCSAVDTIISTRSGVKASIPHATALSRYSTYTSNTVYRTDTNGTLELEY